jgi:hypothetical protein
VDADDIDDAVLEAPDDVSDNAREPPDRAEVTGEEALGVTDGVSFIWTDEVTGLEVSDIPADPLS